MKTIITLTLAFLLATPALAEEERNPREKGFYSGLNVRFVDEELFNGEGVGFTIGYQFNPYIAQEINYSYYILDDEYIRQVKNEVQAWTFDSSIVITPTKYRFRPYASLGVLTGAVDYGRDNRIDFSATVFTYGGGVALDFTDRLSIRVGYHNAGGDFDIGATSLQTLIRF